MTYYNFVWLAQAAWEKTPLYWGLNFTNLYFPVMLWALALAYLWVLRRDVRQPRRVVEACVMVLLVFFATTKLVNEPYALWVLPLLMLVSLWATRLAWVVGAVTYIPILFIAFNVPWPLLFRPYLTDTAVGAWLLDRFLLPPVPRYSLLFGLGVAFSLVSVGAVFLVARLTSRRDEALALGGGPG